MPGKTKSRKVSRRTILAGSVAGAAAALTRFPAPAVAQTEPFRLGLLTVKTGPLAQGGIQMEQGVLTYLKETNYTIGGRKVDFISADTGGNPAGTKTKAQELVERDKVDVILGPLAAFELYAINDYIREQKMPTLSLAHGTIAFLFLATRFRGRVLTPVEFPPEHAIHLFGGHGDGALVRRPERQFFLSPLADPF